MNNSFFHPALGAGGGDVISSDNIEGLTLTRARGVQSGSSNLSVVISSACPFTRPTTCGLFPASGAVGIKGGHGGAYGFGVRRGYRRAAPWLRGGGGALGLCSGAAPWLRFAWRLRRASGAAYLAGLGVFASVVCPLSASVRAVRGPGPSGEGLPAF